MEHNARVIWRKDYTPGLWVVRIKPDFEINEAFTPGQYAELALDEENGKIIRRQYSIASSPTEKQYYEFAITRVEGGQVTPNLHRCDLGQTLWINSKIKGKFSLDHAGVLENVVFVSTGTGIAPFVSMLRAYGVNGGRWKNAVLINGVRKSDELLYKAELENLEHDADGRFTYLPIVSREPGWAAASPAAKHASRKITEGRVQNVLEPEIYSALVGIELNPATTQLFLCGNPAMIEDVLSLLGPFGFKEHSKKDPGHIHLERYW